MRVCSFFLNTSRFAPYTYVCTYVVAFLFLLPIFCAGRTHFSFICDDLVFFPFPDLLAIEEIQNGTSCLLGVLQAIRNLIPVLFALGEEVETALPHTLYAFLLTCVVYEGDHNVVTSTLEVFQVRPGAIYYSMVSGVY